MENENKLLSNPEIKYYIRSQLRILKSRLDNICENYYNNIPLSPTFEDFYNQLVDLQKGIKPYKNRLNPYFRKILNYIIITMHTIDFDKYTIQEVETLKSVFDYDLLYIYKIHVTNIYTIFKNSNFNAI